MLGLELAGIGGCWVGWRHRTSRFRPSADEDVCLSRFQLGMLKWNGDSVEPCFGKKTEPVRSRKQPQGVLVLCDFDSAIPRAQEKCEVYLIGRVGRIWVRGPLQVTEAPDLSVVTPMARRRPKRVTETIRDEKSGSAGPAVDKGRLHRLAEVFFGRHVRDGIMYEYAVELAPEPDGTHVPLVVFTIRIQAAAYLEHIRRQVHQSHSEMSLEVRGIASPAAAEFQEGLYPGPTGVEE